MVRSRHLSFLALVCLFAISCGSQSATSATAGTTAGMTEGTGSDSDTTATSGSNSATDSSTTEGPSGSQTDSGSTDATEATSDTTTATATQTESDSETTEPTAGTDPTGSATDTAGTTETETETETESDTEFCVDEGVNFGQSIPTVVLLIDQSGSMTANFNGQTRWDAVDDALFDPQNGVVTQLESVIRFGLSLYTSVNGFENGGMCPLMEEVPPMLDNAMAMKALYDANDPIEDTPTGEAIDVVVPPLVNALDDGPAVIVLATDGEPDTCDVPDPQTGQAVSVEAAANAYAAGIPVYIISVGNDVSDAHLQDMANAGAGVGPNDPDAPFYKADNQVALLDAFDQIINGVRDCKLALDGQLTEGEEDTCTVNINGQPAPYNDPDGWQVNDPSEIELVGQACDSIQEGDVEIEIKCPCGVIVPE